MLYMPLSHNQSYMGKSLSFYGTVWKRRWKQKNASDQQLAMIVSEMMSTRAPYSPAVSSRWLKQMICRTPLLVWVVNAGMRLFRCFVKVVIRWMMGFGILPCNSLLLSSCWLIVLTVVMKMKATQGAALTSGSLYQAMNDYESFLERQTSCFKKKKDPEWNLTLQCQTKLTCST